jgi:hypothetical protein
LKCFPNNLGLIIVSKKKMELIIMHVLIDNLCKRDFVLAELTWKS